MADIGKHVPDARITHGPLDLGSSESVRSTSDTFKSLSDRLDVLILGDRTVACPADQTKEGYENQLGTDYVG